MNWNHFTILLPLILLKERKQEKYQNSVYQLTQRITAEEWNPDTIAARQKNFAQRAVHIWQSDFL